MDIPKVGQRRPGHKPIPVERKNVLILHPRKAPELRKPKLQLHPSFCTELTETEYAGFERPCGNLKPCPRHK